MEKDIIIWQNINLDIKDYKDWFEEYEEINGQPLEDDKKYSLIYQFNNDYLEDERINLDKKMVVIALADIGRWNGRKQGYKIYNNLTDILYSESDYCKWYCDSYNLKGELHDHDGISYIIYRTLKNDDDYDKIIELLENNYTLTRSQYYRYTKSLRPTIKNIYGI